MVEAVAQGKSQGPVELKFDLLQRPVQGQPLEIAIALLPQTAARSATVAVTGSDGLKVESTEGQFEFPAVEAAQVYRHSIKVTPTAEGFYLLTLSVSLQHDQTVGLARLFGAHPGGQRRRHRLDPLRRGPWRAAGRRGASRNLKRKSRRGGRSTVEPERTGPIQPIMGGFVSRLPVTPQLRNIAIIAHVDHGKTTWSISCCASRARSTRARTCRSA